jgi:hypothetical protein
VAGKIVSKSLKKTLIVSGSVQPLCPENFLPFVVPSVAQICDVEEFLVLGWNVFQEGKDSISWMLISENVEYEPCVGYESVSILRNPAVNVRLDTPR